MRLGKDGLYHLDDGECQLMHDALMDSCETVGKGCYVGSKCRVCGIDFMLGRSYSWTCSNGKCPTLAISPAVTPDHREG